MSVVLSESMFCYYFRSSLLCGLLGKLWRLLCRLWRSYLDSALYGALSCLGRWFTRLLGSSLTVGALLHEGPIPRAWADSIFCRLLSWLLSLPGNLLHRLYRCTSRFWEGSFFCRLAFSLGESASAPEAVMLLCLWCIPFARWNNVYHMAAFVLVLGLLWCRQMRHGGTLSLSGLGAYPVLLFCFAALAIFSSVYPSLSRRFLVYHLICALCVFVTVSAARRERDLLWLLCGISAALAGMAGYAVYQRLTGKVVYYAYMVDTSMNADMPARVQSIFDNPNTFAQVLVLLCPMAAALLSSAKRFSGKLLGLAALVLGITALAMTYSRASYLGFALAAAVFVCLWKPCLIPVGCLLLALLVPLLPETVLNRIRTIGHAGQDSTATSRIPLMKAGLRLIRRRPLWGAGLGSDAVREYFVDYDLYAGPNSLPHTHNLYLQVWGEMGLGGILSLLLSMLTGMRRMFLAIGEKRGVCGTVAAAAIASLCGSLLGGLADYPWHYPRVMCIFWCVFALGLAAAKVREAPEK